MSKKAYKFRKWGAMACIGLYNTQTEIMYGNRYTKYTFIFKGFLRGQRHVNILFHVWSNANI
jgi:hypothetical protein